MRVRLSEAIAFALLGVGIAVCVYGWGHWWSASSAFAAAIDVVRVNNERGITDDAAVSAMWAAKEPMMHWMLIGWGGVPFMLLAGVVARLGVR